MVFVYVSGLMLRALNIVDRLASLAKQRRVCLTFASAFIGSLDVISQPAGETEKLQPCWDIQVCTKSKALCLFDLLHLNVFFLFYASVDDWAFHDAAGQGLESCAQHHQKTSPGGGMPQWTRHPLKR